MSLVGDIKKVFKSRKLLEKARRQNDTVNDCIKEIHGFIIDPENEWFTRDRRKCNDMKKENR